MPPSSESAALSASPSATPTASSSSESAAPVCALLQRLAATGDPAVWGELTGLVDDEVRRVCRRFAGPGAQHEDAVQETWMKLREQAAQFRPAASAPESGARAWIRRIAATTALMQRRSQGRARARELLASQEHAAAGGGGTPDPQTVVLQRELAEGVRACLAELPERERTAVELRHFGDLAYAEIAAAMECPVGSAKAWVSRGLERLRGRLERRGIAIGVLALAGLLGQIDAAEGADALLPASGATHAAPALLTTTTGLGVIAAGALTLVLGFAVVPLAWQSGTAAPEPAPTPAAIASSAAEAPGTPVVAWSAAGFNAPFTGITPVLVGELIVVPAERQVAAYTADGTRRWSIAVDAYHHRPAILGDRVFIADRANLGGFALGSGTALWHVVLAGTDNQSDPVAADGLVILPSRDGTIRAWRAADGTPAWRWGGPGEGAFDAAVAYRGMLLVSDWQHGVQAHDLRDGHRLWHRELAGASGHTPAVHDGSLLVVHDGTDDTSSAISRLAVDDGHALWASELADPSLLGGPVVSGETVVVSGAHAVFGLSWRDGHELWRRPRDHFGYELLVVDRAGRVVLGDGNGIVHLLDPLDGHSVRELPLRKLIDADAAAARRAGRPVTTPQAKALDMVKMDGVGWVVVSPDACDAPLVAPGRIYVTTCGGWLGAIDLPGIAPAVDQEP